MQRWLWLFVLTFTTWSAVTFARDGSWFVAMMMLGVGWGLAWWVSPWKGGRSVRHRDVLAMPQSERQVVIYWRPGCQFCARLKSALGPAGARAVWVNIWQDRDAAAYVRSVNEGNETVPTVIIDDDVHTNPKPDLVASRLGS
ncbi:MAG: glutaredoxin domain-containing protein [Ornithinimicrobium sp.]